jgi:hypothetical protein
MSFVFVLLLLVLVTISRLEMAIAWSSSFPIYHRLTPVAHPNRLTLRHHDYRSILFTSQNDDDDGNQENVTLENDEEKRWKEAAAAYQDEAGQGERVTIPTRVE